MCRIKSLYLCHRVSYSQAALGGGGGGGGDSTLAIAKVAITA